MKTIEKFFRLNKIINEETFNDFNVFLTKATNDKLVDHVFIIIDTEGGETIFASKIINLMRKSKLRFYGIAYKKVSSAAIPIFLATHSRFGYSKASALIHRAKKSSPNASDNEIQKTEKQAFQMIAKKLHIPLSKVYKMADDITTITMEHPFGKKFFIGN